MSDAVTASPSASVSDLTPDSTIRRHAEYYFEDGVVFQVEDTLFKVPRRKLCLFSPVFSDLFALPANSSAPSEGMSDEHPIVLPQVSALDFKRLLTYLYPLGNKYLPTSDNFSVNWTVDYLHSIMRLSKKFMMDDVRQEAIRALNSEGKISDEITKIQLGIEFEHIPWVHEGFSGLITRDHSLSTGEAERLGYEDAFRCMAARETYWPRAQYNNRRNYHDPMRALRKWFQGDKRIFDDVSVLSTPKHDNDDMW